MRVPAVRTLPWPPALRKIRTRRVQPRSQRPFPATQASPSGRPSRSQTMDFTRTWTPHKKVFEWTNCFNRPNLSFHRARRQKTGSRRTSSSREGRLGADGEQQFRLGTKEEPSEQIGQQTEDCKRENSTGKQAQDVLHFHEHFKEGRRQTRDKDGLQQQRRWRLREPGESEVELKNDKQFILSFTIIVSF